MQGGFGPRKASFRVRPPRHSAVRQFPEWKTGLISRSLKRKIGHPAEGEYVPKMKPLGGGRELASLTRYAMWTGAAALLMLAMFLAVGH